MSLRRVIATAACCVALVACSDSGSPQVGTPAPETSAPTPPSATPSPTDTSYWAGDPNGKAACDAMKPFADALPFAPKNPPDAARLLTIAQQASIATNIHIASAGVDLQAAARAATEGRADESITKAAHLAAVCVEERYLAQRSP